jgi:hypothetical protein
MVFSKQLVEGIRRGRIKCSIRFWTQPHVKVGGRYRLGDGQIVVESITPIEMSDVTHGLARESGFDGVQALLDIARHGKGENIYLVRFHYLRPGAWDDGSGATARAGTGDDLAQSASSKASRTLLQRIRRSRPPAAARRKKGVRTA